MLDPETKQYLDNLPDDEFIYLMNLKYGQKVAKWVDCSEEEYINFIGNEIGEPDGVLSMKTLEKIAARIFDEQEYRVVPYYNDRVGIQDIIFGRKPDGYRYQKCIGYDYCLIMGGDMIDYCKTRKCMEPYFKQLKGK